MKTKLLNYGVWPNLISNSLADIRKISLLHRRITGNRKNSFLKLRIIATGCANSLCLIQLLLILDQLHGDLISAVHYIPRCVVAHVHESAFPLDVILGQCLLQLFTVALDLFV